MIMNSKIYDILKWIALVALDAIGVAYKALALIWNWPNGEAVMQTCAIISVLIGTLIGISGVAYNKQSYGVIEEKEDIGNM